MKLATFYASAKWPTEITYHTLYTFRELFYFLFVGAFVFIIQTVKFSNILAATLAR